MQRSWWCTNEEAGTITQYEISRAERFLGCHPQHEFHLPNKQASTLRMIRQIIRDLRLNHGAKILSSTEGYFLCKTEEQAKEYLDRIEKTARSQAKSWMVTYYQMRKIFNIESDYFNQQMQLFPQGDADKNKN